MQVFQVLRVLQSALRMKAQTDSNSRGRKDFICREEKRKTAYWEMQGDLETWDHLGQGEEWGFIAFFCIA
jgi:5-methylcytosine-specific restriction endonuclease McrA